MAGPPALIRATGATAPWGMLGMVLQSTGAEPAAAGTTGTGLVAGRSQM